MAKLTRREYLGRTVVTLAGAGVGLTMPAAARARILGANQDIRLAVIGVRLRGSQLVDAFRDVPGVRIVALCDVDSQPLAEQLKKFVQGKQQVAAHVDFRRVLDDKSIDAVAIATPDHWHALMTVWATGSKSRPFAATGGSHIRPTSSRPCGPGGPPT